MTYNMVHRRLVVAAIAAIAFTQVTAFSRPCGSTAFFPRVSQQPRRTVLFLTSAKNCRAAVSSVPSLPSSSKRSVCLGQSLTDGGETEQQGQARIQPQRALLDAVSGFVSACNNLDIEVLRSLLTENCHWDDYHSCYEPLVGIDAIERYLRLRSGTPSGKIKIDEVVFNTKGPKQIDSNDDSVAVGLIFSSSQANNSTTATSSTTTFCGRGIVLLHINRLQKIQKVTMVREKVWKSGPNGLMVLSLVSRIQGLASGSPMTNKADETTGVVSTRSTAMASTLLSSPPERYFGAWNVRDMTAAADVFTDDVTYDDTAFPRPLFGRDQVQDHLRFCASCFPDSFTFVLDSQLGDGSTDNDLNKNAKMIAAWHVENNGQPLPFTRGISFYELDDSNSRIRRGIDFVDSEPFKAVSSSFDILQELLQREPIRWIPIATWFAYMYVDFVSDGILPGANALALEARTWEEVLNLSLNFFLVAPALNLPFSPVVHPMLEGVFNLLLSWAAMFAGFLSDDRRTKPNLVPMLPIVIGMQFLTSAFLLPYLATRSSEDNSTSSVRGVPVTTAEDLPFAANLAESRILGPVMAVVGSYSIVWALFARYADFGDLLARWTTFVDLLSIDRVGSSFLVDLAIFAAFQGWLVDDDLQRRVGNDRDKVKALRLIGKYIPFFGMALYLLLRPSFPSKAINRT